MYTKTILETAIEFFEACNPSGEIQPRVPYTVYVVFDGDADLYLSGDGAEKFGLGDNITQADMIEEAFAIAESRIKFT